jgi:hypothetical protein
MSEPIVEIHDLDFSYSGHPVLRTFTSTSGFRYTKINGTMVK